MSVDTVLSKISAHNTDVLGCIATSEGALHHNLPDMYELVDAEAVSEYAANMFQATDALETDHAAFDQLFLEYEGHSLYARRLEDGVLVLVNKPMQRSSFKKMQVGVNLFMKPLSKALGSDTPAPDAVTADPKEDATPPSAGRKRWF